MKRNRTGYYNGYSKEKRKRYKKEGRCIDCGIESNRCRCEKCRAARAAHMRIWRANNLEHCREQQRKWREAHPEKDKTKQSQYRVKRKYGLTLEEYHEILKSPCGICGSTNRIVLDHCHRTNGIRGALCLYCNARLGWYEVYKENIIKWVEGKK